MSLSKKLILFGTNRHAICIDDYYMFFRHSDHEISEIFYPLGTHKNRDWWEFGHRQDAARNNEVDPIVNYRGRITVWGDLEQDVFPRLDATEFDFICLGNGTDPAHKAIVERYGRERVLFTEYGWLPWSKHFYISRRGAGAESEIAKYDANDIDALSINYDGLAAVQESLNEGNDVPYDSFIYMPLQKDVNDFKFTYNDFENNIDYLRTMDSIVPEGVTILVKSHPLYRKKYDLSFSSRMIDITDAEYNRAELYKKMRAMICLNSTSILEALSFGGSVFTYGEDLFVNKGITEHKVMSRDAFADCLSKDVNKDRMFKFVSLLLSRQVDRAKCQSAGQSYVAGHYWNQAL